LIITRSRQNPINIEEGMINEIAENQDNLLHVPGIIDTLFFTSNIVDPQIKI